MSEAEALRLSILQQSDQLGTKKRFGLFSQPISTAVGDNGAYNKKYHPRDPSTKKPITQLRNIYISPTKTGQTNKSFFGPLNSLSTSHVKDEYIEPGKRMIKQEKQKRDKGNNHDVSFFTGTGNKILSTPSYPYVEDKRQPLDPKRNRDGDGKVKAQPRNLYTNPQSRVQTTFFKQYKHMDDPFERQQKLERELNRKNRSLEGQAKFRPNSFSPKLFNTHSKVYGEDVELKKKQQKPQNFKIYKHQSPWKSSNPGKQGIYGSLSPFPQYKQSPPLQKKRQPPKQKLRDPFKLNNPEYSKPSCSITLHRSNMRRSLGK